METRNDRKSRLTVYAVIVAFFASGMTNSILSADGPDSMPLPVRVFIAAIVAAGAFLLITQLYPRSAR